MAGRETLLDPDTIVMTNGLVNATRSHENRNDENKPSPLGKGDYRGLTASPQPGWNLYFLRNDGGIRNEAVLRVTLR
jgi:hypothetical protein